jgi:catechol 2,3-dioxygenase-like lactoylglutathione lyase family enzyme
VSDPFKTPAGRSAYGDRMSAQFYFTGMVVADMATSLAFYRHLGLGIPPEADRDPHVEAPVGDGLLLVWDTVEVIRSFDPDWAPPAGGGPGVGLAFRCDSPAEVDRLYSELTGAGYRGHRQPWDAFWGQRYATVLDPDGNAVDLLATLPSAG